MVIKEGGGKLDQNGGGGGGGNWTLMTGVYRPKRMFLF